MIHDCAQRESSIANCYLRVFVCVITFQTVYNTGKPAPSNFSNKNNYKLS